LSYFGQSSFVSPLVDSVLKLHLPFTVTACEANPLLTSLVSCNKTDLYRFHTPDYREGSLMNAIDSGTYCVPFIGVYSHGVSTPSTLP